MRRPGPLASASVLAMLVPMAGASAKDRDWAEAPASAAPAYAASRAICRSLKGVSARAADAPDSVTAASLADCSSEALYFGIGRPADRTAARLCAFVERQAADPQVEDFGFTGDRTLMMVYANGLGAERNLRIATALACRTGFAPAEIDARVRRLARLDAERWTGTDFSLCDDAASPMTTGLCADHAQLVARADRARQLKVLAAGWTGDDRAAFTALGKALAGFADARGQNEVDQSGTGAAVAVVAAEDQVEQAFLVLLKALASGSLPAASAADARAAAEALDARIRALETATPTLFKGTTLTLAGEAAAQRSWTRYRDAWLAFARRTYPAVSSDMLSVRLTRDRIAQLDDVPARKHEEQRPGAAGAAIVPR